MLNILINFVFTLIAKVGDLVLLPIISIISVIIPDFTSFYNAILQFIDIAFTYVFFFCKLLCIPSACLIALVTVGATYLTLVTSIRAYILVLKIYEKFKL